jgi:hypothetical protein
MQTKNNWFDIVKFERGKFAKDLFHPLFYGNIYTTIKRAIFKEVWMGEKIPVKLRMEMRREAGNRKYTVEESQVISKFAISGSKPFISYTVPSSIQAIVKKYYEEDKHQFRMFGSTKEMIVDIEGLIWWKKKDGLRSRYINQLNPNQVLEYYTNRVIFLTPLFRLRFKSIPFNEFAEIYEFIKKTFTLRHTTFEQRINEYRIARYFEDYIIDTKTPTVEEIEELYTKYKGQKTNYKGYGWHGGSDAPAA